jgi:putative aldouronate transport system substrate-binding protein
VNFGHIYPFPAQDGGKPGYYLSSGYVVATALKQASEDRVMELLRIMNWLAAPFGSAEDALLTYGIKDVHYTVDDTGNPVPSQQGLAEARYVPWQYIVQRPRVVYVADIPAYAEAATHAEQALIRLGVADLTLGYYSPSQGAKGALARKTVLEGVRDIIAARRPMRDYDTLAKEWADTAGDQIRQGSQQAIAAGALLSFAKYRRLCVHVGHSSCPSTRVRRVLTLVPEAPNRNSTWREPPASSIRLRL